ncbi:MAG: DNA polymerase III subunit beta [Rhodospirillales bacterium CG15_BIG_FIL_POST_REV_8_21_14_020_66_15]|nr:MAG: DNA polymerase III subunit beta [Rhodospirillales bacterium CG15_BIG_FIL_POST_REV_8_21_14_020_66_15]
MSDLTLDDAVAALRRAEAALKARGVRRAAVFGSLSRGVTGPASDVDVLLDIDPAAITSLFDLGGISYEIERALGTRDFDIAQRHRLPAEIAAQADRDAIYAF